MNIAKNSLIREKVKIIALLDIVEEIKVEGEWSGGSVDGEWNQINAEDTEQEEAA